MTPVANEKVPTEVEYGSRIISFDDAVRFLEAVEDKNAKCPFCSSTLWYVHMADSKGNSARVVYGDSHGDFTSSFRAIQVNCGKCGFVRLHMLRQIAEWLDEQSKVTSTDKSSEERPNE